ncbi:hypothetical protein [Empedobacter brevis]|uniref:hypothetical protein n=1 Tax=Empedobacter brevis TaxID=247 RepID=UPI002FE0955F
MNKSFTLFSKFLTLMILFSLLACYSDDETSTIESSKKENLMLHKNASFLEKNDEVNSIVNEINNFQESNKSSKSSNASDFIIHKENITYIRTPGGERESYTFFIEKEYKRNLNFVENLVLSKKKNSDKYEAVLITYFFPDGYMIDNKDFQVLKTMLLDIDFSHFSKSSTPLSKTSGGGCSYDVIETEHSCYSGEHSGAGESGKCDHKGYGPYSTYELYLSCGGSGGGGGYNPGEPGGSSGGAETAPPGSGGNNGNGGANNGIDTGITLSPSCQGTQCDEVVLPNQINTLLGKKLNISQLMFLYNNENIANHLFSILNNYNTYSQETYLWIINYLSHIDNISAADYFNQNPQDLDIIFYTDVDFSNAEDVDFVNTSTNTIVDLLINNKNNTLSNLDYSWPNLDNLKQKVKNAISKGIYTTAKYTRDYLYIPMVKVGKKYPSTIYWSNKGIDKIRLEAVTPMVNFNENTMNWSDLFNIWLFELTPNKYANNIINFTNSSNIINGNNIYNPSTNAVKNFPKGEPSILPIVKTKLANGTFTVGSPAIIGYFNYNVNAFYSTLSNANIGIQMLGSFPINAKVLSKSGNTAVVQFYIYNDLGWESGTRFIKGENGTPNQGIIKNKDVGSGLHLGGTITNTFTWTETVTF